MQVASSRAEGNKEEEVNFSLSTINRIEENRREKEKERESAL